MHKKKFGKKELFSSQQGLNSHPCTYQTKAKPLNQHMFHDDSHNFKDLSSSIRIQYIHTKKCII